MAIFVTGSTGYLGSYLVAGLFTGHADRLNLLVRAKTEQEARAESRQEESQAVARRRHRPLIIPSFCCNCRASGDKVWAEL